MKLTELAIKRPAFITMVFVALAVLGVFGYSRMGVDLLPKMDWPIVSIVTVYPGAGPKEVESLVSKPLEEAVSGVSNLDNVRSYSYEGVSVVLAQFGFSSNVDEVTNEVQRKVEQIRSKLPKDADPPKISKSDLNAFPILRLSLTGEMDPRQLYQFTKDVVKNELEKVEGVSAVTIVGGQEREIRVEVDNEKLQAYGISILQVSQALSRENLDFPAGKIDERINQYIVRVAGKYRTVADIGNTVIAATLSGIVHLNDIAEVKDTYKESFTLSRLNSEDAIALVIQKQSDANSVKTSDRVQEAMKELEIKNKGAIKFTVAQDITEFTRNSLAEVKRDLFLAVLLVAVVLFLFLHSPRNSLIVLLSIPTSLITTFFFMYLFGYTLNLMSLMALALVIGILVDDSIVVLENIHRHLEKGEGPIQAAIKGRSEIGFAAIAITLVDVVVFLPISMVGGLVGRIFSEFGITVVVSTLLSLVVSFTLTPMLASKWSRLTHHTRETRIGRFILAFEAWQDRLGEQYQNLLAWALDHRKTIIGVSTTLLVMSLALVPLGFVGSEFMTEADRGEFAINIDMPLGTTIEKTDEAVKKVESVVASMPEVQRYLSTIGKQQSQWKNAEQGNLGQVQVKLADKSQRKLSTKQVMMEIQKQTASIPGLKTSFASISMWGSANMSPLQVEIIGSDLDKVTKFADRVAAIIARTRGTVDVSSSWEEGKPEVQIQVDREKMARQGLTLAEVGLAVRTAVEGDIPTQYKEKDTEYDTRVVLNKANRVHSEDVGQISLLNRAGQAVSLNQIAEVFMGKGPSEIQRKDRERLVTVAANLSGEVALGEVTAEVERAVTAEGIPDDVKIFFGGDAENMRDMFSDMMIALGLAILFVYMIMVSLFESYIHPFTIMFSLPMALVGGLLGLALGGMTLSTFSMIGIIMLMGLVTKNAILLVDFTNTLRERGVAMREALLEAGKTRLRPIIMTTATMVFGMMPLALALGAGSEFRQSMAVVIIGGLTSSTLLTLVLVPVVYTYVDGLRERIPALFKRVAWTAKLPFKKKIPDLHPQLQPE
ncbi:MAG: efflux RND transporter permease subunit [Ignavibacteriae bacterium]|nr:efflux RND transporter permease subunit [Ignavibacteriota bacterium]